MSVPLTIDLPPDLAAKAAEIPGLATRLRLYIRAEITQHEKRQRRYSAEALALVECAYRRAEELKAAGITPEQARASFAESYGKILPQIPHRTNWLRAGWAYPSGVE